MTHTKKIKAVSLISGGLDSLLATKVILEQGIHVEGINFFTGFCIEGHTATLRKNNHSKPRRNNALWVAEQLNIKLHVIDIVEEYKNIVLNPKFGYGANLNPCLDCKIFMIQKAKIWMEEKGFDFIITGEVIGQRPKSQRKHLMPLVAKASTAEDRLVRPLSAQLLEPTLPEKMGWINREQLLKFSGRDRKPQMHLAEKFGFQDYAQPAGGCCFLTNEHYSAKLKDFWEMRGEKHYELEDILLLKVGRHLRPRPHFKIIIGREESENRYLEQYTKQYTTLRPLAHIGPIGLIQGETDANDLKLAGSLLARFTSGSEEICIPIRISKNSAEDQILTVVPLQADAIPKNWYI